MSPNDTPPSTSPARAQAAGDQATNSTSEPPATDAETRIFEAALRVFARHGRHGARMQQIADEAEINKAMLHYYFRSKEQLYARVFRYVFDRFGRAFAEALDRAPDDSFASGLRSFIDHYITFAGHHIDVLRLLVSELLAGGEVIEGEVRQALARGDAPPQRLAALIARALERGEIRDIDPRHLMVTIVSGCIFPFIALPMLRPILPQAETDYEGFLAARQEHLYDVIYRAVADPAAGSPA